jgi:hypothetical protein
VGFHSTYRSRKRGNLLNPWPRYFKQLLKGDLYQRFQLVSRKVAPKMMLLLQANEVKKDTTSTQRSLFYLALICFVLIITWSNTAFAHSEELRTAVVLGIMVNLPYSIILLVLGIIGVVFIIKKKIYPKYANFLFFGPSIIFGLCLLPFSFKGFSYFLGYLFVSSPAYLLTIGTTIIGYILKRRLVK